MSLAASAMAASATYTDITQIRISGHGSRNVVIARDDTTGVSVSSEGGDGLLCPESLAVHRDGGRLDVEVRSAGLLSLGIHCDLTVHIAAPAGVALQIDQHKSVADLTGTFGSVAVTGDKTMVDFSGWAPRFDVESGQAVVTAKFQPVSGAVLDARIKAKALVANVGYTKTAPLAYSVTAPVSVFDSALPNTAGAASRLQISSDMLKGSVYAL